MRTGRCFRLLAAATLAAFTFSCATTHLPPISSAHESFEPERDERRLWDKARAEETKLRAEATIYEDPLLVDYLDGVVSELNPPGMAANPHISYRVTVLSDPTLNAFAYPHGSLYVHTGLLARMESEDQLATVLGHEMTHVENRHMLRYHRSVRNKQIGFGIAALAGAVLIAGEEGRAVRQGKYGKAARIGVLSDVLLGLGLTLGILAAVNGYGRDLEREADIGGFEKMAGAGYDPQEGPKVYAAMLEDHGDRGKTEVFFFGSHPRLTERIENARGWMEAHPEDARPTRSSDQEAFRRRMRPVIREDARLNIELGRLELAEEELKHAIDLLPGDAEAHLLLGTLYLKRAEAEKDAAARREHERAAAAALEEAIRLAPERPAPYREAGLLAYRQGDLSTACARFRTYVSLAPQAEDTRSVRDYLLELERDGRCP